jgi:hypothetical protein
LIVNTVPVATEYASSRTTSHFRYELGFRFHPLLSPSFEGLKPIPPVTSTVVKKIEKFRSYNRAIFIKEHKGLLFLPVHSATLLTPDILDEPTPIVPQQLTWY